MVKYFVTKSFFCKVRFIISNEILVIDPKKKKMSPNLTFVVVVSNIKKVILEYK